MWNGRRRRWGRAHVGDVEVVLRRGRPSSGPEAGKKTLSGFETATSWRPTRIPQDSTRRATPLGTLSGSAPAKFDDDARSARNPHRDCAPRLLRRRAPGASEPGLSDPNATGATLAVNAKGEALVSYTRSNGTPRHVLVWGAVNALPRPRGSRRCGSRSTTRAAGGSTGSRATGRRSRTPAGPTTGRRSPTSSPAATRRTARTGRCRAGSGCCRCSASSRSLPSPGRLRAPRLALDRAACRSSRSAVHWTYGHSAVGLFGQLTYQGQPVYGFGGDAGRQPEGSLLAQRLHRHAELDLRRRVAPRDGDPPPPSGRDVLPQLRARRHRRPGTRAGPPCPPRRATPTASP